MNAAQQTVSIALAAADQMLNLGQLAIFSGTLPVTPETTNAGGELVKFQFAAAAFAGPSFSTPNMQSAATFVASSVNPDNNGAAAFARATVWAWVTGTAVAVGQYTTSSSNLYRCITAGTTSAAPSGVGATITDGTATWTYVAGCNNGTAHAVADYTVGTSGTDIVIGSTTVTIGTNVSISSFLHKMPAV